MARKEDKEGKIQGNSLPEVRAGLKSAALFLADAVKRDGRQLEEGPILSRLTAWFLLLDDSDRAEIIEAGHRIIEHLKEAENPPKILDGSASVEVLNQVFGGGSIYPASMKRVPPPYGEAAAPKVGEGVGRVVDVKPDGKRAGKAKRPSGK